MSKAIGIPNPPRRERLVVKGGNTNDIIRVVMQVANDDRLTAQVADFANKRFKGTSPKDQYEKLKELWKYTRREITYEEDPPGKQLIKEPARVFWDNQKGDGTDCKSLSLFEYFCCRAIGVPCYFEFVSYYDRYEWENFQWVYYGRRITHVYPVAVIPGYGEVVIDAVYNRFDERAPNATRVVKKFSKVFNQMADISIISGTRKAPTQADLVTELRDRAKNVKPSAFVDYTNMTEGEMETFLLADRAKKLYEFYQGTPQGNAYLQQFLQKRDLLFNGLHRSWSPIGVKSKTRAASGWLTLQQKGIDPKKGFKFLFNDAQAGAERASVGAIPQQDCNATIPIMTLQQWTAQGAPSSLYQSYVSDQEKKRAACATENKWRTSLNKYWEAGSLTLVYRAIPNSGYFTGVNPNAAALIGQKKGNHVQTFNLIQQASQITPNNLSLWWENGNIANTIAYGLGPQTGLQFVDGLKANRDVAVNGFIAALASVAIDCLKNTFNQFKLFVGVCKGDLTLKQAIEQHIDNVEEFFKKHSDDIANLASNKDFKTPGAPEIDAPPITCTTNAECPLGWHCEGGICVPDAPPPGGGSTGGNNAIIIGGAALLALVALNGGNND